MTTVQAAELAAQKNSLLEISNNQRDFIASEQTQLLFTAMPISVIGSLLGIFFVSLALWGETPSNALLSWSAIFTALTLSRGLHAKIYLKKIRTAHENMKWRKQFAIGATLAACFWSSTAIFLYPDNNPVSQVILAFVLTAASAIAINSLSPVKYISILFVTILLLPLTTRLALQNSSDSLLLSVMLVFLYLLLLSSILRLHKTIHSNIVLRYQSIDRARQLRESQQRLTHHMQRTPLAVIEWDPDTIVSEWNSAAEKIFGYSRSDILGKPVVELLLPKGEEDHFKQIERHLLDSKSSIISKSKNLTRQGKIILCEWYSTPLLNDDGTVIGVASLIQDVTERVRLETMKSEFVSIISHELRTPLTSIRGSLGLLLGLADENISHQNRKLLSIANNNTLKLLNLIDDILDIERMERGALKYTFKNTGIMPLVESALESNSGYAAQFDAHLEIGKRLDDACVMADEKRIVQVIDNLLSNAIKFSPRGSHIVTDVYRHQDKIKIAVNDCGPGIDEDFREQLFDKFTQADSSTTRGVSGSGLGLSIAKGIVLQHNGHMDVYNRDGEGCTFFFELPETKCSDAE